MIIRDIVPEFELADVWKIEMGGKKPNAHLRFIGRELYDEGLSLIKAAATFDLFPVREVRHNRLLLENGACLTGADIGRFLAPAVEIAAGIATVGPLIEERSAHYFRKDEGVHGYLLDCIGTVAITRLTQLVCERIAAHAAERSLPPGFPMSPGDAGWPLADQRILFKLVDGEAIGVHLTDTLMMLPQKSVSFVVGLGPGLLSAAEASQCDYCSIEPTCRHSQRK